MGSLFLPTGRVLSVGAPNGQLSLFSSGWRLTVPAGAQRDLSFHLDDGNTLRATVDAASACELWGNADALWLSRASALTLLPPMQPVLASGGIPLPIG